MLKLFEGFTIGSDFLVEMLMISLVKNYQMQLGNLIWEASRALLSSLEE